MAVGADNISPWQLFVTASAPVLEICLLGVVGLLLERKNVLSSAGRATAASLCFHVFTPALTFSKLVQAVSPSSIAHLWPLLANMGLSMAIGLALGVAVNRALATPPRFRNLVLAAVAFGNVGNLPLVFVWALCRDRGAMFYRLLGDSCDHLGVAYVAFNICAATVVQFTYAVRLLRPPPELQLVAEQELEAAEVAAAQSLQASHGQSPVPGLGKRGTVSDLLAQQRGAEQGGGNSPRRGVAAGAEPASPGVMSRAADLELQPLQPLYRQPHIAARLPFEPSLPLHVQRVAAADGASSRPGTSTIGSNSEEEEEQQDGADTAALLGAPAAEPDGGVKRQQLDTHGDSSDSGSRGRGLTALGALRAWLGQVDWAASFPLPTQAAFFGIAVGCWPWAKGLLYAPTGSPPLRVVAETLDILGGGLIPTAVPLLGAVLSRGPGRSRLPWRVTLAVLLARLVLLPAVMTGVLLGCLVAGMPVPDPMYLINLFLANATPTAINMQTITVLYRHGEAEMSSILFTSYLACIVTLPIWMWLWLHIVAAMAPHP